MCSVHIQHASAVQSAVHKPQAYCVLQKREDAEKALKALDGLALHGMEMNIGWGKAVPLPPVPLYSGVGVPTGPLTGGLSSMATNRLSLCLMLG